MTNERPRIAPRWPATASGKRAKRVLWTTDVTGVTLRVREGEVAIDNV